MLLHHMSLFPPQWATQCNNGEARSICFHYHCLITASATSPAITHHCDTSPLLWRVEYVSDLRPAGLFISGLCTRASCSRRLHLQSLSVLCVGSAALVLRPPWRRRSRNNPFSLFCCAGINTHSAGCHCNIVNVRLLSQPVQRAALHCDTLCSIHAVALLVLTAAPPAFAGAGCRCSHRGIFLCGGRRLRLRHGGLLSFLLPVTTPSLLNHSCSCFLLAGLWSGRALLSLHQWL
mmetsp:Transcript_44463/g.81179  ORF Transcript_44463/g.81179 Transcript_44463/m.81179 type:complete len:234 (-) Transcript_44463:471-1172(-)